VEQNLRKLTVEAPLVGAHVRAPSLYVEFLRKPYGKSFSFSTKTLRTFAPPPSASLCVKQSKSPLTPSPPVSIKIATPTR
jgi:hypothetical protein